MTTPAPCTGHESLEQHEAFLDHTAAAVVSIACAAFPDDLDKAEALALYSVTAAMLPHPCPGCGCEPQRPMDTSDLDPETGEEYGVIPGDQVWVEIESTRDDDGKLSFTAFWPDGEERLYHMRLTDFEREVSPLYVKVLTSQQAQAFHANRTEVPS